jgi:prepilin-type N-terminal cleavage/methylation domain-containing protein
MKNKAFSMIELLSAMLLIAIVYSISFNFLPAYLESVELKKAFNTGNIILVKINQIKRAGNDLSVISDGTYLDSDNDGFSDDLFFDKKIPLANNIYFDYNNKTCTDGTSAFILNVRSQNSSKYYQYDSCIHGKLILN